MTDADLPALERYLAATEPQSLLLLGNARKHGIDDRGGALHGRWIGAFEGSALLGVAAWFRGFGSLSPACGGHAQAILPVLLDGLEMPRVVVGTAARVAEALEAMPWTPVHRQQERLLVLRWEDHQPMRSAAVRAALPGEEEPVAEAIGALHAEGGLPTDREMNRAAAARLITGGDVQTAWEGTRLLAMSCEGAANGRYVHVGATWCARDARRRGLAGSCVSAVLERARSAGRASVGAELFTGRENVPALRLYERLGFRPDADWEMAFLC